MEGIDFSFEKDLFGKRNDIEDDTVIFQIYSDENLDEIYIGRVKSSQKTCFLRQRLLHQSYD